MQAQFRNSPFLIASQEYCTYFLFPPFLASSAVISPNFPLLLTTVIAFFFSILWSLPFSRRIFVASTSHVHCGTPFPDVDTFRGTGRCRISQLYNRYACTVRTQEAISCSHVQPHTRYLIYHREHDIRFLATPFLIVLLLSAISYGSFLIFSKI